MTASLQPDLPQVEVTSRSQWRRWLIEHADESGGVWAVTYKKASVPPGREYVSAIDLNEECLCVGWIDSKPGKIDEERTALLCTPRAPGSGWSKVNKDRLERLLAEGLVTDRGRSAIDAAKRDGSWSKLDSVDALEIPDDLIAALARHDGARANFDGFPPSARRGILEWIASAKREATRSGRIAETAEMAARNLRANQWPRP